MITITLFCLFTLRLFEMINKGYINSVQICLAEEDVTDSIQR